MKQEQTATLTQRVRRSPPSMAGSFYYLEAGETVYVSSTSNGKARVSILKDPENRISEDYFSVPLSDLKIS